MAFINRPSLSTQIQNCVNNAVEDVKRGNSAVRLPLVKEITKYIIGRTRYLEKQSIAVEVSLVKSPRNQPTESVLGLNWLVVWYVTQSRSHSKAGCLVTEEVEIAQKEIDEMAKEETTTGLQ